MKTLKSQKMVIWSLVVMLAFSQAVPTVGWAATRPVSVEEMQAQNVPQKVVAEASPAELPAVVSSRQGARKY